MQYWLKTVTRHVLRITLLVIGILLGWRVWAPFPWEIKDVEGGIYTLLILGIFTLGSIPAYLLMAILDWKKGRLENRLAYLRPFIVGTITTSIIFPLLVGKASWPIKWVIDHLSISLKERMKLSQELFFFVIPFLSVLVSAWLVSWFPLKKRIGRDSD